MSAPNPIVDVRAELIQAGVLREGACKPPPSAAASVQLDEAAFFYSAKEILAAYGREAATRIALDTGTDRRVAAALEAALSRS